jgi:hypothetical protein
VQQRHLHFVWFGKKNLLNSIDITVSPSVQQEDNYSLGVNGAISSFDSVKKGLTEEEYTIPKYCSVLYELIEERIDLNAIHVINNFENIVKSTRVASNILYNFNRSHLTNVS